MLIAVPKEIKPGETRVAATPDIVQKYKFMGLDVQIQSGAGEASGFSDRDYLNTGAEIKKMRPTLIKKLTLSSKYGRRKLKRTAFSKPEPPFLPTFRLLHIAAGSKPLPTWD